MLLGESFAQKATLITVCKQDAFAASKPLPKLVYDCQEGLTDSDDKILHLPGRAAAIKSLERQLAAFSNPEWWHTSVEDLNVCDFHGSAGELTDEEKEKFKDGDYQFQLIGNQEFRLLLAPDPCYQTGFNGANAFLLYRKEGKVYVNQLLNGYYSRVNNSVGLDSADLNGQQLIEVSTANSIPPAVSNYYFVIDPENHRAIPKKIFKDRGKLTNKIDSAMLMNELEDFGLPKNAREIGVIRGKRVARSFSVYADDDRGTIDDNGRKLRRIIYRWNGRYFVRTSASPPERRR